MGNVTTQSMTRFSQKFSKVNTLLNFLCEFTTKPTFEKIYLQYGRRDNVGHDEILQIAVPQLPRPACGAAQMSKEMYSHEKGKYTYEKETCMYEEKDVTMFLRSPTCQKRCVHMKKRRLHMKNRHVYTGKKV